MHAFVLPFGRDDNLCFGVRRPCWITSMSHLCMLHYVFYSVMRGSVYLKGGLTGHPDSSSGGAGSARRAPSISVHTKAVDSVKTQARTTQNHTRTRRGVAVGATPLGGRLVGLVFKAFEKTSSFLCAFVFFVFGVFPHPFQNCLSCTRVSFAFSVSPPP